MFKTKILFTLFISLIGTTTLLSQEVNNEKEAIIKQVSKRIKDFQNNLIIIADENNSNFVRDLNIKSALDLFASKEATIEVSNKFGEIQKKTIKDYLYDLKNLRMKYGYDKVIFEFDQFEIDIIEYGNGIFKLNGTYKQYFNGIINGKSKYCDFTIKIIDIIVKESSSKTGRVTYKISFDKISVNKTIDYCIKTN